MPSWLSSREEQLRALLILALLIFLVTIISAARAALVPFFLGLIVAYVVLPGVNFIDSHSPELLRRTKWSRPLAIIIVYIGGIGLIAGLLSYFIPAVSKQASVLSDVGPRYIEQVEALLTYDLEELYARVPPDIATWLEGTVQNAISTVAAALQVGLQATLRTVSQTVSFVLGMLIIPFWLFYVLNDATKARNTLYRMIPKKARADVRCIVRIVDNLLSAYIRGQLILCLVVGVMAMIILLILGIDLALLFGTIAGILEVIPILGPYLGAIPPILVALIKRPILAVWVAVGFAAIQQIENIFLVPRISGRAVRFHPAVVMVIVVMAAEVAGLWGLLLAVPVTATLRDVYQYLYLRTTERGATPEMALDLLWARSP